MRSFCDLTQPRQSLLATSICVFCAAVSMRVARQLIHWRRTATNRESRVSFREQPCRPGWRWNGANPPIHRLDPALTAVRMSCGLRPSC
jgi:hypothetical protein